MRNANSTIKETHENLTSDVECGTFVKKSKMSILEIEKPKTKSVSDERCRM